MSVGNKNAWQTAANRRWQANLRATLERCQRYGGAYEAEHLAEAFNTTSKMIYEFARRWGLIGVLRDAYPTVRESRTIQVPGRSRDPQWQSRRRGES